MCIVFSVIECVFWCSRVTLLSMFVDGSSYVSVPRPSILCIHFIVYFENEMSDLLLGVLGHCPFHHYVCCWCDFTPCLIWVNHYSSSCYLLHHHSHFCFWFIIFVSPLVLSYVDTFRFWYPLCIIITHLIINLIFFIASLLLSYSHWAPSGPWLTRFSVHVAFHTWGHGFWTLGIWA